MPIATTPPNRPDGMPENLFAARQWCRCKLREAVNLTYKSHDLTAALMLVQEAEHGLRIIRLESQAGNDGVVQ